MPRNGASSNKRSAPSRAKNYKLKLSPAKHAFSNGTTNGGAGVPPQPSQQQQTQECSPPPIVAPSITSLAFNGTSSSSNTAAPSFSQQPPTKKQRTDGNISLKLSYAATPTARPSRYSILPVVPIVQPMMTVAASQESPFSRQQQLQQSKGDGNSNLPTTSGNSNQLLSSQVPASTSASIPFPSTLPASLAPSVLTRVNSWTDDPDLLPDGDWPEEDAILHSVSQKHAHTHHNHHKSSVPTSRMTLQLVSMGPTSGPPSTQAPPSQPPSTQQNASMTSTSMASSAAPQAFNSRQREMEDLPYTIPSTARQSAEIDMLERSDSPDSIMQQDLATDPASQTPLPLPLSTPSQSLLSTSLSPVIASTKEITNSGEPPAGFALSAVTEGSNENMDDEEEQQDQPSSQTEAEDREQVQNEIAPMNHHLTPPVVIPPTASSDTSDQSATAAALTSGNAVPSSNPDAAAPNTNSNLLAPPSNGVQNSPLPSPASSQPSASQSAASSQSSASAGGSGGGVQLPHWPDEFPSLSYLYSDFPEENSAEQAEEEYQNIARDAPRQDSTNDVEEEAVDLDQVQERRRREQPARRAATIIGTQAQTQLATQIVATQVLTDELEATQVMQQPAQSTPPSP